MKHLKSLYKIFALVLVLSLAVPISLPSINYTVVQAATIKISQKSITLEVGNSTKLKLLGTSKKATWTTSNKSIATVSNAGKVTAIKKGSTKITATLNKKKYICNITVKDNPDIKNAPFNAKEADFDKFSAIIPKNWTHKDTKQADGSLMALLYPTTADITVGTSNITIIAQKTNTPQPKYDNIKNILALTYTEDLIKSQFVDAGMDAKISEFKTSDFQTKKGMAFEVDYIVALSDKSFKQTGYILYIDNYCIGVTVTDNNEILKPDIYTVAKYILDTFEETK